VKSLEPETESPRPEPAATPKGAARAARILNETLAVITEHGHRTLTLEEIARRVGIAKGNLQYYFPTRGDLLRAAFAQQIDHHKNDWLVAVQAPAPDDTERLRRQIAFELQTNHDTPFVTQVTERHALSRRDPLLRNLGNDWLQWVTGRYADLISSLRPELTRTACLHRAIAIYTLLVGVYRYTGTEPAVPEAADGLDVALVEMAMVIALSGS
jgi:AcrR family transcriptional regulator